MRTKSSLSDFEFAVEGHANGLCLVMPYPPSLNRYWRNFRGRMVLSSDGRAYKAEVARVVSGRIGQFGPIDDRPVSAKIVVYRPRKSGDLDNLLKCVLDSLQGVAYRNDSQVTKIFAERLDDKDYPRVEITIERL